MKQLTEEDNREYLILYGENLNIENSDEIILLYNGTTSEYNNVVFMNTLLGGFIRLTYYSRINATHYRVKMVNKEDMSVFDKQITLDEKYIIVKYNNKNKGKKKNEKIDKSKKKGKEPEKTEIDKDKENFANLNLQINYNKKTSNVINHSSLYIKNFLSYAYDNRMLTFNNNYEQEEKELNNEILTTEKEEKINAEYLESEKQNTENVKNIIMMVN